jgi:ParB/RepB/Spo0J family partition protein
MSFEDNTIVNLTGVVPDAPADTYKVLPLDSIVPSLTNPRTTFNQPRLQELAESIKASGVHQPILVRPLPSSRLQETFDDRKKGAPLPAYELVVGERRYRASKLAGNAPIP